MNAKSDRLGIDDSFDFHCGKDLECFNLCCRDINLFLTPYDIVRIKRCLNVPSYEFLKTYTLPLFPEEIGHPVVLMRMMPDESRKCPFVDEGGCMIYEDRPWSCRSFPLEPTDRGFEMVKRDFCMGFGRGTRHTARKWRDSQNVVLYEEINEEWKKVTHHENFSSRNILEGHLRDIFFLGSYNIDEFRNLVFHGDFLKFFEVDKSVLKKIRSNETELLRFSFRWMRHVLFGDATMKRK